MSVGDRGVFTLAFQDKLFEVIFIDPDNLPAIVQNLSGGSIHNLPTGQARSPFTNDHSPDQIACFIYEPLLQGAGGMKMYEAQALDELLKTFQEQGIICIADEVMTGFGRTGKLFASEYMATKPDIICLSKGLTGGTMALGVTACSEKVYQAFVSDDKLKTFFHGHSFTANPLACTAALASLDLLQKPECILTIQRITEQHKRFIKTLTSLPEGLYQHLSAHVTNSSSTIGPSRITIDASPLSTKNHRQLGTVLAFEIDTNGKDEYLNQISPAITEKALSRGVFIRPLGNTVYIMPPYCITEMQLQKVYDVIVEILNYP